MENAVFFEQCLECLMQIIACMRILMIMGGCLCGLFIAYLIVTFIKWRDLL